MERTAEFYKTFKLVEKLSGNNVSYIQMLSAMFIVSAVLYIRTGSKIFEFEVENDFIKLSDIPEVDLEYKKDLESLGFTTKLKKHELELILFAFSYCVGKKDNELKDLIVKNCVRDGKVHQMLLLSAVTKVRSPNVNEMKEIKKILKDAGQ